MHMGMIMEKKIEMQKSGKGMIANEFIAHALMDFESDLDNTDEQEKE